MNGVCNGNHLGISIVCKLDCLQGSHGISGKADTDDSIITVDTNHLFEHLTYIGSCHLNHISTNLLQVKCQKSCQRSTASHTHHIHMFRRNQDISRRFKSRHIQIGKGVLQFLNVCSNHRVHNLRLRISFILLADLLHGIHAILHPCNQIHLKLRIPCIADKSSKTNYRGFTDPYRFSQLCCSHKNCLIIMLGYISRYIFLPFTHSPIILIDSGNNILLLLQRSMPF